MNDANEVQEVLINEKMSEPLLELMRNPIALAPLAYAAIRLVGAKLKASSWMRPQYVVINQKGEPFTEFIPADLQIASKDTHAIAQMENSIASLIEKHDAFAYIIFFHARLRIVGDPNGDSILDEIARGMGESGGPGFLIYVGTEWGCVRVPLVPVEDKSGKKGLVVVGDEIVIGREGPFMGLLCRPEDATLN